MSRHLQKLISRLDIPLLPKSARLQRHNLTVDLTGEIWKVEQRLLDWRDVAMIHPLLLHVLKLYFSTLLERMTADTIHKNFRRMVQACSGAVEFSDWEEVDGEELALALEGCIDSALTRLSAETVKQTRTMFRNFYDFLEEYDLPFYRNEFHARLSDMYFGKTIPHKGVMTLDPEKGPLSRIEEYYLVASLELDGGDARDIAIISLTHAWGLRPRQISSLNFSDFIISETGDYTLRVPRVKQHAGVVGAEYKLRKLTARVGGLLKKYVDSVQTDRLSPSSPNCPMFLDLRSDAEDLRLSTKRIAEIPSSYVKRKKLLSPLTNKQMVLSSKRLRETFGTRCAEMPGMTKEILAGMLDHNSTRSLEVYFDFRESAANEMGRLIAARKGKGTLRDLIDTFMGEQKFKGPPTRTEFPIRFISNRAEATFPEETALRLMPPELIGDLIEMPYLGSCGGFFRCGIAPVITCYSCFEFEPWIEADHDAMVIWIGKLHQRALDKGQRDDAEEFDLLLTKAKYVAHRAQELRGA